MCADFGTDERIFVLAECCFAVSTSICNRGIFVFGCVFPSCGAMKLHGCLENKF